MTQTEALKLALEFVEANHSGGPDAFELITAIKEALSETCIKQKDYIMSSNNTGIEMVFNHIEASAPCSLEGVACWVESQLSISTVDFVRCIDSLIRQGAIEITVDGAGLVIDLR